MVSLSTKNSQKENIAFSLSYRAIDKNSQNTEIFKLMKHEDQLDIHEPYEEPQH